MKTAVVLLLIASTSVGQTGSARNSRSTGLVVELRTSSGHVQISDDLVLTVIFRSVDKDTTIWNALGWGVSGGLYLQIRDSSGREVENGFAPSFILYLRTSLERER